MQLLLGVTVYLVAMNVVTFLLYAHDKRRAQEGARRVPERRLIFLALAGGALGAFVAMRVCHHKTRKPLFRLTVAPLMVVQALAYACLAALTAFSSNCYRADAEALAALESDGVVSVSKDGQGWLFDGPGTEDLLVFYPGGNVECEAYAPLMHELAAGGIDCVVVDMPFHLAFLGAGRAAGVMRSHDYDGYYLGGHSLGGVAAGMFAADHADELSGLVLLASYSTDDLSATDLEVLSVHGTNDGVLDLERYEDSRGNLPATTEELVIDGANHAQFGSYGEQAGDGEATISEQRQRDITEAAILDLIG